MENFIAKTVDSNNCKEFASVKHLAHYILLQLQYSDVCKFSLYEPNGKLIAVDVTPRLGKRKISLSIILSDDSLTSTFVCDNGEKLKNKIMSLLSQF